MGAAHSKSLSAAAQTLGNLDASDRSLLPTSGSWLVAALAGPNSEGWQWGTVSSLTANAAVTPLSSSSKQRPRLECV